MPYNNSLNSRYLKFKYCYFIICFKRKRDIMINNTIIEKVNELIKKLNIKNYTGIIVYGSYVGERNNSLRKLCRRKK